MASHDHLKEEATPVQSPPGTAAPGVATATAPLGGPYIGIKIKDRYRIERELGRGGFGVVYLARDEQLSSRPVVIKVLLEQSEQSDWFTKKFREEREALARLDHPGVVGVLDCGETPDGKPFLAMQFVDGITLRVALRQQPMPLDRVARLMRQIGQALSAAHDRGVYHRDLKPENIMLQDLGEGEELVKIIDFGIATVREGHAAAAPVATRVAGSGPYMSPEHLLGRPSVTSDTYSLGVIAYEMVTGRRPFEPESLAHLYLLQKEGIKTKPADLRPDLPAAAQDCILKALAFDESQRYTRARDFSEELARALTTQPAAAEKAAPASTPPSEPALEMAHVLFMDLVGYSLQSIDRQTRLLQQLQEVVRSTEAFRRAQASNELLSLPTGDGMALVFFRDPAAPAHCAIQVARALKSLPEIRLRMGIHTGPVYQMADINANINVAGGGINLAQRVMNCGDTGHILVSRTVAEVLMQVSEWAPRLHDLGEHKAKHDVSIHIFNLYTEEAGNPEVPEKLRSPAPVVPPPKRWTTKKIAALLLGTAVAAALAIAVFLGGVSNVKDGGGDQAEHLLRYSILVQKPSGESFPVAGEMLFPAGYGIRFLVSSPEAGYLYIFNEGPESPSGTGTLNIMVPGEGESAFVPANGTVKIPNEPDWIRFDAAQGTERLWMVWSAQSVPDLEAAKAFGNTRFKGVIGDPARQTIQAFLKKHHAAPPTVEKDEVNKQTNVRGRSDVLVRLLNLEHR